MHDALASQSWSRKQIRRERLSRVGIMGGDSMIGLALWLCSSAASLIECGRGGSNDVKAAPTKTTLTLYSENCQHPLRPIF